MEEKDREVARRRRRRRRRTASGEREDEGRKSSRSHSAKRRSSRKRKQKRTAFNVVSGAVLVVAVCVFVFSLYQLIMMILPYYSGGEEYDKIKDLAITVTQKDPEDGGEEEEVFSVDFDALLSANPDTVGWIRFDEPSVISYPVVKSADNNEYLTKTFTANDNKLGTIFMDMRNSSDFSDRNTMIYGHNLKVGGEMFSQLNKYADESFCKQYPNFYIYTPDGKMNTYTVFSAGVVKDTADNYDLEYLSDEEFETYLQLCRNSSNYQVDVEVNKDSKIVSLSTCTNVREDERFLVQGVLTSVE